MASSSLVVVLLLTVCIVCTNANIGIYPDVGMNPGGFDPIQHALYGAVGVQDLNTVQQYPSELNTLYTGVPSSLPSHFALIGGTGNIQDLYPSQQYPLQINPSYTSVPANVATFSNANPNLQTRFQTPYPGSGFVTLPSNDQNIPQFQTSQPKKSPIVYIESKISEPERTNSSLLTRPDILQQFSHYPQNVSPIHVETDIPKSIPVPERQSEIHSYPLRRPEQFMQQPLNHYPQNIPSNNGALNVQTSDNRPVHYQLRLPQQQVNQQPLNYYPQNVPSSNGAVNIPTYDIRPTSYQLRLPEQQISQESLNYYPQNVPTSMQHVDQPTETTFNPYPHIPTSNVNLPGDFHISYPQTSSNPSWFYAHSKDYILPQQFPSYPQYVNAPVHSIRTNEGIVPVKTITIDHSNPEPGFVLPVAIVDGQAHYNVPVTYVDVKREGVKPEKK